MNMVGHAADFQKASFLRVDNSGEIAIKVVPNRSRDGRPAVFRCEDDVILKLRETSHNVLPWVWGGCDSICGVASQFIVAIWACGCAFFSDFFVLFAGREGELWLGQSICGLAPICGPTPSAGLRPNLRAYARSYCMAPLRG